MNRLGLRRQIRSLRRRLCQHADLVYALFLSLAAFTLYAFTAVRGPLSGDHGEFQYMPRILGLPHPTGYPLYIVSGWLWSWLPVGSVAFRMNLFSAFWAALTAGLLYGLARQQGLRRVAALIGVLSLGLAPVFWRYAGLAAVYSLHSTLLAAALFSWLCWSNASQRSATKWLWTASFLTGLALTNHPTAAFLVPASLLFVLLRWVHRPWRNSVTLLLDHRRDMEGQPRWRSLIGAAFLFALPGILYLYVPIRLWTIGPGRQQFGLSESIATGKVAPFLDWTWQSVLRYITGGDFLGSYDIAPSLLVSDLPGLLVGQFGLPLVLLGAVGGFIWLIQRPRSGIGLTTLFLLAAVNAVSYNASFAEHGEVVHLGGHLVSVFVVFALWIAQGLATGIAAATRVLRDRHVAAVLATLSIVAVLAVRYWDIDLPVAADRAQSQAIEDYWTEVLCYPLEEGSALTGHWGDLTSFWYYQHGEGLRRDLWAIFPPNRQQIGAWLDKGDQPVYLAGPLLDWGQDLSSQYRLTPWGILVRIDPLDSLPSPPPLQAHSELLDNRLQFEGYTIHPVSAGRWQLWLGWRTAAPTSRDLSVSVRLHVSDGGLLLQEDGRMASAWFPEAMLPSQQLVLSVFDLKLDKPPGNVGISIVVYDPYTMLPLLTEDGRDVFEIGSLDNGL